MATAALLVVVLFLSGAAPVGGTHSPTPRPAGPRTAPVRVIAGTPTNPLAPRPAVRPAVSSMNWYNLTPGFPSNVPGLTTFSALAYDPALNGTLMFGGYDASLAGPSPSTWLFANGTWTDLSSTLSTAPVPRWAAMLTWDPWDHEMILFGGRTGSSPLNDTWSFTAAGWTNITPVHSPAPRQSQFGMFDADPTLNALYLYGGYCFRCGQTYRNDSWTFVNGVWTNVSGTVAAIASTFDYGGWDPAASEVLGYTSNRTDCQGSSATYGFNGTAWTLLGANSTPGPVQTGGGFVYDGLTRSMILWGGGLQISAACKGYDGTWSYTNGTWTNLTVNLTSSPPPRCCESIAYDGTQKVLLLEGGVLNTNPYVGDTWSFPSAPLSVKLNATPSSGGVPLAVNFTANVSGGATPLTLNWSFGDGSSNGSGSSVLHTYPTAGGFVVNFTATDSQGRSINRSLTVYAVAPLVAGANASVRSGEAPLKVSFTANSTGGRTPYNYSWAFGDGTSGSGVNASHVYRSGGTFVANVTVNDGSQQVAYADVTITVAAPLTVSVLSAPLSGRGDVPFVVNLTAVPTGNESPFTAVWQFGDGSPNATGLAVRHQYNTPGTYLPEVTVTDAVGHEANGTGTVTAVVALHALASASRSVGVAPLSVTFSATASNGTPTYAFTWSFGDQTPVVTGAGPSHLYSSAGTYTVRMIATDTGGGRSESDLTISVVRPLNATISGNVTAGILPLRVAFTSTLSGGLVPASYAWLFGDGAASAVADPNHEYPSAGAYTVDLTVSDSLREVAHATMTIVVYSPLRATLTASPSTLTLGQSLNLTAAVTGGSGGPNYSWGPLPPGCTAPSGPDLGCTPTAAGSFNVTVTVHDSLNDPAYATVALSIDPAPGAGLGGAGGTTFGISTYTLVAVAAGGAIIGAGVVLLILRRRGPRGLESSSQGGGAEGVPRPSEPDADPDQGPVG